MSDRLIFNVVVTLLIIVCSIPVVIDNSSETPMFMHIGFPVFILVTFWCLMYSARKH